MPAVPAGPPRSRADAGFRVALIGVYLALIFHAGVDHAMWRDEAQAWLIARDASGLGGLLDNLRYEGHPALWYAVLFVLTRFGDDPNLMLALNFVVMGCAAALVVWSMPLHIWERILFPFGLFMLFEYGVKARSYGLGLLLMVLLCLAWPVRRRRPWLLALLLALVANVHVLFFIVSIGATVALVVERLRSRQGATAPGPLIGAAIILAAGWAAAIAVMVPVADSGFSAQWHFAASAERMAAVLAALSNLFGTYLVPWWIGAAAMVVTIVAIRGRASAAILLAVSVAGILAFGYVKYSPHPWHHGVIFVAWLSAVWLARSDAPDVPAGRPGWLLAACVVAVLGGQAVAGVATYAAELRRSYSHARAVASYIVARGWQSANIAVAADYTGAAVRAYLGPRPLYSVNARRWDTFTVWDKARLASDVEAGLTDLDAMAEPVVLIADIDRDDPATFARHGFTEVARFVGSTWSSEDFVIYIRRTPD